ncbi:MAG: diiron oxygenase, partial [Crenarchaeota archaeon]|nr:diiron oxygenase [Thermoproteota archaeon]
MRLSEILYEIKVTGDLNYLKDLMRDEQIKSIISGVCKRHRCKADVARELLKDYT